MTRSKKEVGPVARAWLAYCQPEVGDCGSGGLMRGDETVFIDRRPSPPVAFATDTIIGWHLDPRWLE
jgi:hypothetical protein